MKNLINISQVSKEEVLMLLEKAEYFKTLVLNNKSEPLLKNRNVLSLFYEMSTRTKISFELASKNLSASFIHVDEKHSSLMKGEDIIDMMKTLESMNIHFLILRHPESDFCQWLASKDFRFSIINAGNGIQEHPTQALLDLLTIQQSLSLSKKLKILFWGDVLHSRVFKSLYQLFKTFGFEISIFSAPSLIPKWLQKCLKDCTIETNPEEALKGADVIYAIRMQVEKYLNTNFFKTNKDLLKSSYYTLSQKYLKFISPNAVILHPGPINRSIELTESLTYHKQSKILNQVENGTYIRMAVLSVINNKLFSY